jgi:hypothetical protein
MSMPRLVVGETHVVLCTEPLLPRVLEALTETGAGPAEPLGEDFGVPRGWVVLRGVTPVKAVPPAEGEDILNALCPLADLEIVLDGGIRIAQSTYLAGHPPKIRLHGQVDGTTKVLIDGAEAVRQADGSFVACGWDAVGDHTVWCGVSKTNAVRSVPCEWGFWEAYSFTGREGGPRLAITGALVRPSGAAEGGPAFVLAPPAARLLLGAAPGEVFLCPARPEEYGSPAGAFVPFEPVWAVPDDPLGADKAIARVMLIGKPLGVRPGWQRGGRGSARRVRAWCDVILNCGRKNLAVEPAGAEVAALWATYKRAARSVRRVLQ